MNGGSTQNRNSAAEYACEQRQNSDMLNYQTFKPFTKTDVNYYFSIGSVPQTPREHLSHNSVDTESFLRNIGSSNLVTPPNEHVNLDRSSARNDGLFYDTSNLIMPKPLVVFRNQRPGPTL